MEKKHSEKEKTSLDSPSPKLNKSMIAYHETGDLFADTCEIVESAQSIAYAAVDTILVQRNWLLGKRIAIECLNENGKADYGKKTMKKLSTELKEKYGVTDKSAIFFIADEFKKAQKIAGLVRIELGKRLDLLEKNTYRFCFIVDFPMYELSDEGTIDFNHNPFSMPQGGLEALENKDPLDILAYQFDLVCNGYEMASGAVRNHNPEVMVKAFEIAGYKEDDVKSRFGALYNAFQYGAPPHAGAAPGIDRMVMLIADSQNIREIIAFPKNKRARDLLMRAPSRVSEQQLDDVHIKLK